MQKVLITGGCGFIGSHLAEYYLNKKYKVFVIDNISTGNLDNILSLKNNKDFKFYKIDISKKFNLDFLNKKVDYVFHLAALADIVPSIIYPEKYFNANVVGTFNLMQKLKNIKLKKIIYSASSSCYGIPDIYPTDESSIIDPRYPYALTKFQGEEIVKHWSKIYSIPYVSLRFFNVYGPRSRTSGTYGAVFGVFLAQKLAKKPFTVVGNGKQTRDFTYVSDVIDALDKTTKSKVNNVTLNIGSGNTYSINYLTKLLDGKRTYIPKRPGEPDCTWADISKAKKVLKWKPKVRLEIGVNKLIENINYWNKAPVWDKKSIKKETKNWFKFIK